MFQKNHITSIICYLNNNKYMIYQQLTNGPAWNDMFRMKECFNIFYKAAADMKKSQNNVEQMTAIAGLLRLAIE